MAKKLFGNEDPVGKNLLANFKTPYTIDAVFEDLPINASFRYDAYCSYPTSDWVNEWSEYSFMHIFKANPNTNFDDIAHKISDIPRIKEIFTEYTDYEMSFRFLPIADLHFTKNIGRGNKTFANTLVGVAVLVLLMAFINFINFGVANAPRKVRSINMRRVVGESKARLLLFMGLESMFLMLLAFVLALGMCYLTLAFYPDILGYSLLLLTYSRLLALCLVLFLILGALFSVYPSLLVVSVKPAMALKGLITFSAKHSYSGKILTVIQYAVSILLIIGVLFLEKQISFLKNYDLGFQKENILVVSTTNRILEQENAFAAEIMKNPNITDYAYSQFVPGGVGMGWGRQIDGKQVSFKCWPVDERYLNFMGFEIVDGRNFSVNIEADENNFIFNQKALQQFGWSEGYLGKNIPGFDFTGKLIGVVKDMKYASLHEEVQPMAFWLTKTRHNSLSLKISNENVKETIQHIKDVYDRFEIKYPINYFFLDERLNAQYKAEEKQAELIALFCLISIIISIIGALGLIIFMCEYRVKEIGVRKINGATVFEIVAMLNQSFVKWVALAFVFAVPAAYFMVDKWLQGFAHRTDLSWWVFLLAGITALFVALSTVSWISWRAARRNPVEALRYE
jgi:putative ABC transport system permease protein